MDETTLGILLVAGVLLGIAYLAFADKKRAGASQEKRELDYGMFVESVVLLGEMFDLSPESKEVIQRFSINEKKGILEQYYKARATNKTYHMGCHAVLIVQSILSAFVENIGERFIHPDLKARIEHDAQAVKVLDPIKFGDRLVSFLAQKKTVERMNSVLSQKS